MTPTPGVELDTDPLAGTEPSTDPSTSSDETGASVNGVSPNVHASPFARIGAWTATHFRRVLVGWLLVLVVFGFFAVRVEGALAGAGWQASNSQSVQARAIIERDFSGLGATALQVVVVDHRSCLLYT